MSNALKNTVKKTASPTNTGKLVLHKTRGKRGDLSFAKEAAHNFLDKLNSYTNEVDRAEMLNTFLEKGYVSEEELSKAFAAKYKLQHIDNLGDYKIPKEVTDLISQRICQKYTLIPLTKVHKSLVVVLSDPSNTHAKDNLLSYHKMQSAACGGAPIGDPQSDRDPL